MYVAIDWFYNKVHKKETIEGEHFGSLGKELISPFQSGDTLYMVYSRHHRANKSGKELSKTQMGVIGSSLVNIMVLQY